MALAIGGSTILAASNPYFGIKAIGAIRRELDKKNWRKFYKELDRLRNKKRISVSQNPNGSYNVEITNLGKNLVNRYNLDELTVKKPDQWDGFWRFCSFDIPGPKKHARQAGFSMQAMLNMAYAARVRETAQSRHAPSLEGQNAQEQRFAMVMRLKEPAT